MTKVEQTSLLLNGKEVSVKILRKDNKNTYVRLDQELNIVVSTNRQVSRKKIFDLIAQNESKILTKMATMVSNQLADNQIKYLGTSVTFETKVASRFKYEWSNALHLILYQRQNQTLAQVKDQFYQVLAKELLAQRLTVCYEQFKKVYDISFPLLVVRKMKARYGTCYYHQNKINLNQNLVQFEVEKIDFVIFHELTHLIHPNHSPQFYAALNHFVPNHKTLRKEINKL
jgi:predicted metal-dependent hydrolase